MKKRDRILARNLNFFDSKPLTTKAWSTEMDIMKDDFVLFLT